VILVFFIFCISCKKKNEETPTGLSCRIITALDGPNTYHFTYDSEGKLSSLHTVPTKQKFTYTYEGNITNMLVEIDGKFLAKFIITNNSQGFTTNIRRLANEAGTVWNNQSMEYNGTQLAKILYSTSNASSPVFAVNYTWKDGNIASQESGGSVIEYEYYTDKPAVAGEWRKYGELVEGNHLFANKNCTKSIKNGGEVTSFTYEFDDAGKILKMTTTEPGNAVSSVQYEYSCN
jgi:YD repeat-containing protein